MSSAAPTILCRVFICGCMLFGRPSVVLSQINDTTTLEEITLTAKKSGFSSIGKKTQVIDSASRELFKFSNAADLLSYNAPIYVKSYGPGAIATTALRGGSAEQTAILWNGMNMQNTMLGQTDLSLLPVILFESVGIEYGGSASLWGSGAVGGSIQLGNRTGFGKQFRATLAGAYGSEGRKNSSASIVTGGNKIVNTTKIYGTTSTNQFRYMDLSAEKIRTMSNAPYSGQGFMNELRYTPGRGHVFSVNAWLNQASRVIASYNSSVPSKQNQYDNALRLQGSWDFRRNTYHTQFRSAYFNEGIDYNDSISKLYTQNKAVTMMLDDEHFLSWGNGHEFHAGLSLMDTRATSGNYDGKRDLRRYSFLVGNRFQFFGEKLQVAVNGRAEYFSATRLPVTGNMGLEYHPRKWLKTGVNLSTFYRQPTLNELYWTPGGNRNLHPEEGQGADAVVTFQKEKQKYRVSVSGSAFTRKVRNWILWVPGTGGNPFPMNLQEVWSRGAESTTRLDVFLRRWRAGIKLNTSYVLSTIIKTELPNSGSLGKQLIYTPLYTANGALSVGFKNTSVFCLIQYAGYRFTSTDNSQWLDPYFIVSLRATQALPFSGTNFTFFAAANNLFNTQFAIQAGKPMPLRTFEAGLTIYLNRKQKNENK